jgi:hypothetical protein
MSTSHSKTDSKQIRSPLQEQSVHAATVNDRHLVCELHEHIHYRSIPVAVWSKAARLLGLRVWIPPGAWMALCFESCVLSGISASAGWSLFQKFPTDCGVSEFDSETSIMGRPWPTRGCCAMVKYIHKYVTAHTQTHIYYVNGLDTF